MLVNARASALLFYVYHIRYVLEDSRYSVKYACAHSSRFPLKSVLCHLAYIVANIDLNAQAILMRIWTQEVLSSVAHIYLHARTISGADLNPIHVASGVLADAACELNENCSNRSR
jgi:hypothetical protein